MGFPVDRNNQNRSKSGLIWLMSVWGVLLSVNLLGGCSDEGSQRQGNDSADGDSDSDSCRNIMNDGYINIGVGYDKECTYWTQTFGG